MFIVLALVGTMNYAQAWEADRSGAYLAAARETLAAAGPAPLLDQPMPPDIMWTLFHPWNNISRALSPLEDRPPFADTTTDLRALDVTGHLRPAEVVPSASVVAGPVPDCGWLIRGGSGTVIRVNKSVLAWEWTLRLDYSADRDGKIMVELSQGVPVPVEVRAGSSGVFVRLVGGGQELRVTQMTPGLTVCVGGGVVGKVAVR